MKVLARLACIGLPLALVLTVAGPARSQAAVGWTGLGKTVALELSARQFDQVVARFDPTMAAVLSAAKLAATWDGLLGQVGAYRRVAGARQQEAQGYHVVFVTCQFDRASLDLKIAFDASQRIAGLFFVPTTAQAPPPAQSEWKATLARRPAAVSARLPTTGQQGRWLRR